MLRNFSQRVHTPLTFIITLLCLVNSLISMEPIALSESNREYPLGFYIEILEDKEGILTIDDIQKPEMEKNWIKSTASSHNFGFTKTVYWTRFKLETQIKKEYFLEIAYTHLDKIDFFILSNGKEIYHRKAGDHLPFEEREIKYRNFVFVITPYDTPNGIYLLRFQTESSMQFPMTILSPIAFGEKKSER